MRHLKFAILGLVLIISFASCRKWLDVNTDPDNPNNESVLVQNRLPWIQHFYTYTAGVTNFRTACQAGIFYSTTGSANAFSTTWVESIGNTTPYQTFFIEVAPNLPDLYKSAQEKGAYHYMAAADVVHALGYMEMLDLYGEMPYTEATAGIASPKYDDGKTIFYGCMAKLDEAIDLFSKPQEAGAPSFAEGDMWNNGDAAKWIKFCYGLKARYMLKLSKKSDLFKPDSILYFLSKGPQSNADNVVQLCYNNSTVTDYLLGDPIVTNGNWDYAGYGSNQRVAKFFYDQLTNLRGAGVTDPRMTKIVPASMSNIKLGADGKVIDNEWNRSKGVDSYGPSTRLVKGGATSIIIPTYTPTDKDITYTISDAGERANFIAGNEQAGRTYTVNGDKVTVTYKAGSIFINSTNFLYAGDTAYVNMRSFSLATGGVDPLDVNWYPNAAAMNAGAVGGTGSFQIRPNSDQEILTYHEMCFIKAEVYMRKGDRASAYQAYMDGIRSHINMMQTKLAEWQAAGYADNNPDMAPMDQGQINAYLTSGAIAQGAGDLTMSDIMMQKYISMGCSIENYNDMRRFNFSAGNVDNFGVVYPGYDRGPLFAGQSIYIGTSKTDPRYWQRRWKLPTSLELNYNRTNALAINAHAAEPSVWSIPVWWDTPTDADYFNYLK
ncbi:MAG: SusD/RagB family nutrient-binding outer membrane lipoprotein [Flavisolibacter sp.]